MTVSAADFRKALAQFATGVTVITGRFADGRPAGMTVSAFSSLSLEPPLVLFCLGKGTSVEGGFIGRSAFTAHVLAEGQDGLSNQFASSREDRFGDTTWTEGANGCPLLDGCLARIQCEKHSELDGGDHVIVVGRVVAIDYPVEAKPLVYQSGGYRKLA
ncbi:MAG: flavin reductase family protein [Rhodospirillales bacterium]